jgi:PAS domain S-box-containing protein
VGGAATLESSEAIVRALAAHTPLGIFVSDADGGCVYVNERWCELTGLTPEQALGDGWAAAIHPDDAARALGEWATASRTGSDSIVEYRFLRPDGGVSWIQGFASAMRDDRGRVTGWVGSCLDLTIRKRAEEAAAQSSARFQAAFDDAPIGMALVGLDGSWLRANASLCQILGYDEPDLLELRFQDLTHPDDLQASLDWTRGLLEGEYRSFAHEKRYVRRDGTIVWAKLSVSLVRDAGDDPLYFVGQIEDVHDRKLAEAETVRLLEREREHVERLRALDVMRDEFVASVSHELRTPLTSIKGYLELVLDGEAGDLNEEQRGYLDTVNRNSERLLGLVGDLLFVAQADAGRLELNLDDVDLGTLAHESVESARPAAAAKRIRLELFADELPSLRGDHARLAQLFDNLVSNALKFTPEGGSVTVSLARGDGRAVLEVRDTGIGIPAAEQKELFGRFFRARGATDRAIQGTGLGLSIARTIAESHGGTIGFESVEGVGTTFRVEVPLDARTADYARSGAASTASSSSSSRAVARQIDVSAAP